MTVKETYPSTMSHFLTMPEAIKIHFDCAERWRQPFVYCLNVIFDIAGLKWSFSADAMDADLTYGSSASCQSSNDTRSVHISSHPFVSDDTDPSFIEKAEVVSLVKDLLNENKAEEVAGSDWLLLSWLFLSGEVERCFPVDPYGVPNFTKDELGFVDCLARPVVNDIAAKIVDLLEVRKERDLCRLPCWPDGKRLAVVLTHDVDEPYSHRRSVYFRKRVVRCLHERKFRLGIRSMIAAVVAFSAEFLGLRPSPDRDPNFGFDSWMKFEASIGSRSTFYVATTTSAQLGSSNEDVAYDVRDPEIVTAINRCADSGWEVSLHASINASHSSDRIQSEKNILSEVLADKEISGVRHHYWAIDCIRPETTWNHHKSAHLQYDSSLGMNQHPGFRRGVAWPFLPFDARVGLPIDVVQIPPTLMDGAVDKIAASYSDKLNLIDEHLAIISEVGGLGVLDWHLEQSNHLDCVARDRRCERNWQNSPRERTSAG